MMSVFLIFGALAFLPMLFDMSSDPDDDGDPDDGGGTDGPGDLLGETLNGTDGADTLSGSGGDDLIYGNDGADLAEGGDIYPENNETGDDTIYGGSGSDTVIGGFGYDLLYGGADSDTVQGWNGADTLYGGGGDDSLTGDDGNDLAYGGEGNDTFSWMAGNDTSYGGAGDDNIFDASQSYDPANISVIDGGAGNDSLGFDGGSTITGGTGDDSMWLFAGLGDTAVTVITDFNPAEDQLAVFVTTQTNVTGELTLVDWEDGLGADLYYGTDLLAQIGGAQGMDPSEITLQLRAEENAGPTVIEDGAGDTTLIGNSSDDTISGGGGDDLITVGGLFNYQNQSVGGEDLAYGGDGQDTLSAIGGEIHVYSNGEDDTQAPDVEQTIHRDTLFGGDGDDLITALNGAEMTGGAGADTFGIDVATGDRAYGFTFEAALITDFDPAEDSILIDTDSLLPGTTPQIVVWEDGTGCDIMTGDIVLARVTGGQTLTAADIGLAPSLF